MLAMTSGSLLMTLISALLLFVIACDGGNEDANHSQ